jgi:transposase
MDFRKNSPEVQIAFRRRAVAMFAQGASTQEIASCFGVAISTAGMWKRTLEQQGEESFVADARAKNKGKPPLITPAQEESIRRTMEASLPDALGIDYALWTRDAVCVLCHRRFGITLRRRTVNDYLLKWGLTPQVPVTRAREQSPAAIKQWVEVDYPALDAKAKAEDATILWCDETGVSNQANVCRSYAPEGVTPELSHPAKRITNSVISAISNKGDMRWMICKGAANAALIIRFLARLVRSMKGRKVMLIWDNLRVHKSKEVTAWLAQRPHQIETAHLPPYAPQYQPDERLNRALKGDLARRPVVNSERGSVTRIKSALIAIARTKGRVTGLFSGPLVSYAAAK